MSSQPTTTNVQFSTTRRSASADDERSAERSRQVDAHNAMQQNLQLMDRIRQLEASDASRKAEIEAMANVIAGLASGRQPAQWIGVERVSVRIHRQYLQLI